MEVDLHGYHPEDILGMGCSPKFCSKHGRWVRRI